MFEVDDGMKVLVKLLIVELLLMVALCCSGGMVYGGELRMQVLSPMQRVFLSTPVVEESDPKIELWAARNEYESTQMAVYSEQELSIDKVESTDLINPEKGGVIAARSFSYRFPGLVFLEKHYEKISEPEVEGKVPGWFPDPLEERQKLSFQGTRSVYLTWHVPPDTPPGDYRGELQVQASSGLRRVPVLLHVWSFTLPQRSSLYVTNWLHISEIESKYQVKQGTGEFWRVIEKIAQDMAAHRQNVIFTPLNLIRSMEMPDGSYRFDFRDYERWVGIFLNHGFQEFEGSHLFHAGNSYSIQRFIGSGTVEFGEKQLATPEGQQYLLKLLQALHHENQKLGIQDKYLQHVADEAGPKKVQLYCRIAALVRTVMPGVPIIDATGLPVEQRPGMMDIPVTTIGKPAGEGLSVIGAKWGKWWYQAVDPKGRFPNRFIDYPLSKTRIIPWVFWRAGMSGYLHYAYNYWYAPSGKTPWQDVDQSGKYPPGDGFVVYPPRANRTIDPVSSLRWEAFRDGLEDYEYLNLLDQWTKKLSQSDSPGRSDNALCQKLRDQSAMLLQEIRTAVASPEEYPRDPRAIESLRRRMGEVLDKIALCTGSDLSRP